MKNINLNINRIYFAVDKNNNVDLEVVYEEPDREPDKKEEEDSVLGAIKEKEERDDVYRYEAVYFYNDEFFLIVNGYELKLLNKDLKVLEDYADFSEQYDIDMNIPFLISLIMQDGQLLDERLHKGVIL